MLGNDLLALAVTFAVALLWLRIMDYFAQRGWISSTLSRKIIHMGTGPLFVLCWLLFSEQWTARLLAALVPLLITIQFALVGLGIVRDEAAVQAMSRSGDRREILRGPLYYGLVFVLLTLLYWRHSPIGINALMLVCGGDGLADILGRRWGNRRLPWNRAKSWVGSLGFLGGGILLSALILAVYRWIGILTLAWETLLLPSLAIAMLVALVESISPADSDNLTIPLAAVLLGELLWG